METSHPGAARVEVHDFVPDLQPYLASATVAVAPIQLGAGVSNKIMEAFSVGTSVVATPMACGDLPVRDGEHLFIADDRQRFAMCVLTLLNRENTRKRLVRSAQTLVRAQYDWELVSSAMERLLSEAAGLPMPEPEAATAAAMP
jgi:glycosyltransferase involved in cell wall biosynthesis